MSSGKLLDNFWDVNVYVSVDVQERIWRWGFHEIWIDWGSTVAAVNTMAAEHACSTLYACTEDLVGTSGARGAIAPPLFLTFFPSRPRARAGAIDAVQTYAIPKYA